MDIAVARINEIIDIIFNKNINLESIKEEKIKIFLTIKDKQIFENFNENFKSYFSENTNFEINFINDFEINELIKNIGNYLMGGKKRRYRP